MSSASSKTVSIGLSETDPGIDLWNARCAESQLVGWRECTTRTGCKLRTRAAGSADEELLRSFFAQLSAEDLRYRFLSTVREVGRDRLLLMTDVDHCRTESLLAFAAGTVVATAMLAADPSMARAEVAIAVRSDHQRRGIGSCLMEQVTELATQRGISTLESIASRENCAIIELERRLGFTTLEVAEDASLVLLRRSLRGNE